ncbi:hypothetical protein ALC57_15163, partial [Trachymyrmex cornetzi]
FNARIGQKNVCHFSEDLHQRKSKDRFLNADGEVLINLINMTGWGILNGNMDGDWQGEYREYTKMKRKVKKMYRKFKASTNSRAEYIKSKVKFKDLYNKKAGDYKRKVELEINKVRNETEDKNEESSRN